MNPVKTWETNRLGPVPKPDTTKGVLTVPNALTLARIVLIPVFLGLIFAEDGNCKILALLVFTVASLTDFYDGRIARREGTITPFGRFMDPLADKLMVVTTLVMLVAHGWLPAWMVALLICRELTITALRTIAVSEGLVLAASTLGKFKTSFQATALGFLLWHHETVFLGLFPVDVHACGIILMYFALFFSLVSGWSYLHSFFRHAGSLNTA